MAQQSLHTYLDRMVRTEHDEYLRLHPRWALRVLQTHTIMSCVENELEFDRIVARAHDRNETLAPRALVDRVRALRCESSEEQ